MSEHIEYPFVADEDLSSLPDAISKGDKLDILPYFPSTLVEMIQIAAKIAPDRGILYVDEQGGEDLQTYPDLLREAGCVLKGLREKGLPPGNKLVIQVENDRLFITTFWGAILGGFIPVPLALPKSFPITVEGFEILVKIMAVLHGDIHIITDQSVEVYKEPDSTVVLPIQELLSHDSDQSFYKATSDDIAYLQFSSGSTGDPKGVALTHRNLVSNIFAIIRASANEKEQKIVDNLFGRPPEKMDYPARTCSWFPYSHDMGIIGFHLVPLSVGALQIKLSTKTFVAEPSLNIKLIDKYRATHVPSTNFGLQWMLSKVEDKDIKDVDLSCVDVLYNGAEPISAAVVRLFIDRFSKYGFNPKAMLPVYGMSEATLLVTAPPLGKDNVYHVINRDVFSRKHIVTSPKEGAPSIEFADEGYPAMGMEVRIVDDEDKVVKERVVGHVQIKGPNVIREYYNNDEANKDLLSGEWLRTGDLGFIKEGRLTITGRYKDVIFVNGQNYYSSDLEKEIQVLPFVDFGNLAICGITDYEKGLEKIILFMKTRKSRGGLLDMLSKINEHLSKKMGVDVDSIIPIDDIPRTTSGKVQRFELCERYEDREFEAIEIIKGSPIAEEEREPEEQPDAIIKGEPLVYPKCYFRTLNEMIVRVADEVPQRGIIYVDKDGNEDMQAYPQLFEDAKHILGGLRAKGLEKGAKVILQLDDPRSFISSFWGILLGGFIPVPITLPHSFPISEGFGKLTKVWHLLDNPYIVTDQPVEYYKDFDTKRVFPFQDLLEHTSDDNLHEPDPDDVAYIQFSSGSTGDPKGVVLTHKNLLTNLYGMLLAATDRLERELVDVMFDMRKRVQNPPPVFCSWLPYTHDMGLVGFHLGSMVFGGLQIKMRTRSFVENPTLYLKLVDKYRAVRIASPNFGLLWMVATVKDEDLKDMDLSCILALYNGAEPISPAAVNLFIEKFSKYGFNPEAMAPAYGMAEASLLAAVPSFSDEIICHRLDREKFTRKHIAIEAEPGKPFIEFVDEGYLPTGMEIRIVDDDDRVVKESVVSHVQIKGPNVTGGYYNNDEANKDLFCGEWLRTGDLGFIKNGRFTITGRYKDVIFVSGQNYYSADLEEELQLLPFVGFKNMAICGVTDYDKGSEKIVLFMKTRRTPDKLLDMLTKINEHMGKKMGMGINSIVPMSDIPRTTSGKVQRFKLREGYEAGEFEDKEVKREDKKGQPVIEQREAKPEKKKEIDVTGLLESLPLAIAEGDKHLFLAPVIRTLPNVLKIATIISPDNGILHVDEQGREDMQTYADLLHSAQCVLGGLRDKGLTPGTKIILQIDDSKWFLSGFWGAVLGGFVPVLLPLPNGEDMEGITKACKVLDKFYIVADQPKEAYTTLGDVKIFDIKELLEYSPDKKHYSSKPDDIAYLQFSSGSKRDSRGVMLTHHNLLSAIDASIRCILDIEGRDIESVLPSLLHMIKQKIRKHKKPGFMSNTITNLYKSRLGHAIGKSGIGKTIVDALSILSEGKISPYMDLKIEDIRVANSMPYSHEMGLIGFHIVPTLVGLTQVNLSSKAFRENPALFLKLLDKYKATHVPCPDFGIQLLTAQVTDEDVEGIDLSCLKGLSNGSEPISPAVTREFMNKFSRYGFDPRAMYMFYDLAEACFQATAPPVFGEPVFHKADKDLFLEKHVIVPTKDDEDSIEFPDLGFPVPGMKIRVVDDNDQLLHEGMVGHIQIQGPSVMKAYYNNPEANKDLFCDGWLRTGDMGFIKNGRISITKGHKDIVSVGGRNFHSHDTAAHIQKEESMSSGEAAALKNVSKEERESNDIERFLLTIWKETLQIDKIRVDDNFFDLGGNSLRATKIISRIREELGIELSLRTIFENQTIEVLAQVVEAHQISTEKGEYQQIVSLPGKDYYEVSHAQRRLWFLDKIVPDSPFYNIHGAVMLENTTLDLEILRKALQLVVDRHETLRTTFTTLDERPVQIIADSLDLDLPVVDITDIPSKDQDAKVRQIIDEESLKPFDLGKGPLFRTKIIRLSKTSHAFVVTIHHIIADGWSMGILVQEAVLNYSALSEKKPFIFPELTIQYKDFAHWQNNILTSEVIKGQEAYWLDTLKGELPVLNLPIDHPRPKVQTQNGVTQRIDIDLELTHKLREIARGQDVTLFMLLLAAFKVLLHKLTGQDDIIVGSPIAGRNRREIEPLIGFFVNMLPMRSDLSDNPEFSDFLQQVKQTALGAYANQDYPFDKLVEVLNPARDISRSPVFDVTFEVREASADPFASTNLGEVSLKDITGDDRLVKFDMSVTGYEGSGGITMKFEYNADLLGHETIERMMTCYLNLIKEIVDKPDKVLSEIDILSKEEKERLLIGFNDTNADFPTGICMHKLFELQAKKTPDKPAVVFNGDKLTYEALDKTSNQLAGYLKKHGVGNQDLVGIVTERCPEMITAYLGVWKTGAAYVPIDPEYPKERIRYMLEDSGAKVVLTHEALLDMLPEARAEVISLDSGWSDISKESKEQLDSEVDPESLAYVIYTSGSTGRPKGSLITHKNVVNLAYWHDSTFGINEDDRASQLAGVAFDAVVWEIWPYLLSGASVFPLERRLGQMLPEELAGWFEKNKITRAFVPTKLAEVFLGLDLSNLSIKTLFTGGDRLSYVPKKHGFDLINNYGPTETAVVATSGNISAWAQSKGLLPIGRPISNVSIYILDDHLKPVPLGVAGEICISGAGVGKGYLNDPSKTSESFILNPFSNGNGLIYKTGDLGRWLKDGSIDFIGRRDSQVEVRGYRVELGEIETALSEHDEIKECIVLDKTDDRGNTILIAFYVSEKEMERETLLGFLRERLPHYMIPSRLVYLEELPMTPNGKADRDSLLKMVDLGTSIEEYVAPRNETEQAIAEIWKEVLGVDRVCIYDNFFDLGGHSLMATQVVSRIKKELEVDITLRTMFEEPTIEGICKVISDVERSEYPEIKRLSRQEYYEVSHAQKRLWYLDKIVPDSPFYNIFGAVMLEDVTLDLGILGEALQVVVNRHETLRTTIATVDGKPVQVIADSLEVDLPVTDISDIAFEEQDIKIREIIDEVGFKPFDLEKGPLFRVALAKLSDTRHAFVINMHHIIADGWSIGILAKEAMTNYTALLEGRSSPFEELDIQYKDFAYWQNELISNDAFKEQEAYWLDKLGGELPVLNLPADHPRPTVQTQNGTAQRIKIDLEQTHKLRELARSQDATLFMLLLSAFKVLLHKLTGQDDIIVGCPIAGRNNTAIESLIGFFVNVLPMRSDLSGNPKFSDFLQQIKQIALGAYANQDYPFDKLVEALNPVRDISRSPVFDVTFDVHEASANPFTDISIGGVSIKEITGNVRVAKFDMTITGYERSDGFIMDFEYNTDLFEQETVERIMKYYQGVIQTIIATPDVKVGDINILDKEEREKLLRRFNDTYRDFPKHECTHELFEKQAKIRPDKTALVFGDDKLTYAQLNEASNKFARYLRVNGVGRGTYVAIMVERSIDMLVGVLGILKAGGAYVPIESEYPKARIKYMLDEIEAPVVVVHDNLLNRLPEYAGKIFSMDQFWNDAETEDGSDLENVNSPEDIAYVIYTSGSTGSPKGVMIPHISITRLVKNTNYADMTPNDRFLQASTFAFDAATLEFWGPLLNGGTLFLASSSDVLSPDSLAELLLTNDITILFLTTVLFNQLIDTRPDSLTKLKRLLVGGEVNSVPHFRKCLEYTRPECFASVYGPTENTTFSTYYDVDYVPNDATSIPIGYPIANSTLYILDEYLKPVPIGVPGEIYLGGYGLAQGYLNDPEKTANAFIPNPIPDVNEDRLYKTGDLGKWLPDGSVDFLGRIDTQVKIKGHRIELGEIESVLTGHREIKDSVVIVKEHQGGNRLLVAYYVAPKEISVSNLRSFLKDRVPDYMIPHIFIMLDGFPLNSNGKVDKSALPEPKGLRPEMETKYVAPRNATEQVIVDVWKEVIGVDKIGVYDNFFDLGGDSIISLQVVSRLNQKGYNIQPRDILQYQCIADLAPAADIVPTLKVDQGPVVGTSPLTPIQRWFFEQDLENRSHFNQGVLFRSEIGVKEEALRKSLQILINHHDVLRMRFKKDGDSYMQEFMPLGEAVSLVVKDLSEELNKDKALEEEISELQRGLDIEEGPVFRVGLYHTGDDRNYLLLVGHHLVVDGVSWRILLHDLIIAAGQVLGSGAIALPDKTTSYRDWAHSLDEYARSDGILKEASYWEGVLPDSIPELPTDHDLGVNDIASTDVVSIELGDKDTHALLKGAHRAYNTEVNDLLLTALIRALQGWTGRDDVLFDLEGHGREDMIDGVDISRTVGWFTTIFPVALSIDRNADIGSQIKYVKEMLHTIPNKGFNFGVLKYMCGMDFDGYISAGISFNYLGQVPNIGSDSSVSIVNMDVKNMIGGCNKRPNLIDVLCLVIGSHLKIEFVYSKNKHMRETIESLALRFKDELSRIIFHCIDPNNFDITPSDFELAGLDQSQLDKITEFK